MNVHLLVLIVGIVAGAIFSLVITFVISRLFIYEYGTLHICMDDPETDIYQIEINRLDNISKKKRVMLRVKNNAKLNSKNPMRNKNNPYSGKGGM